MRRFPRDNGLTLGFGDYRTSSDFAVDAAENRQSEYLQFFLFVMVMIWLIQRGSPESKRPSEVGLESDEKQQLGKHTRPDSPAWARTGGWRTALFSRSLGLTMAGLFLLCWLAQFAAGRAAHNGEKFTSFQDPLGAGEYLLSADIWNRSSQNWQSEFLAIASMAILSVYLRQRGSPESKPVGAAHRHRGVGLSPYPQFALCGAECQQRVASFANRVEGGVGRPRAERTSERTGHG